jgi:putative ABC transport system permease protein
MGLREMDRRLDIDSNRSATWARRARRRLPPLAWRNLAESKVRLAASVAGTTFAVTLMFMQLGFRGALLDSMVAVVRSLDGDLFLIHRLLYTMAVPQPIAHGRLEQARSFDEVTWAGPFYVEVRRARWRNPADGIPRRIRVLAYPPADETLAIEPLRRDRALWERPDTVMADVLSKAGRYGPMERVGSSELSGRRVTVVGTFALGTDFESDGTLVMSEENFLSVFPDRRYGAYGPDVGVLRVRQGTDLEQLRAAMLAELPHDVDVLTKPGLVAREQAFWDKVAPIGTVFMIGVVMGFIVGMAICYQVLYADIGDRLGEFATLKAMGYSNSWLFRRVVEQSVYLSLLGYAAGVVVSLLAFRLVHAATGLPMLFRPTTAAMVLLLTVLMCILSGAFAARRLVAADPAQLYA